MGRCDVECGKCPDCLAARVAELERETEQLAAGFNARGATIAAADADIRELRAALARVLASAVPNRRDHPAMSAAWEVGQAALDRLPPPPAPWVERAGARSRDEYHLEAGHLVAVVWPAFGRPGFLWEVRCRSVRGYLAPVAWDPATLETVEAARAAAEVKLRELLRAALEVVGG